MVISKCRKDDVKEFVDELLYFNEDLEDEHPELSWDKLKTCKRTELISAARKICELLELDVNEELNAFLDERDICEYYEYQERQNSLPSWARDDMEDDEYYTLYNDGWN